MEFRLLYEGPLKTNRGVADKQHIRRQIHPQLKELVARPPMKPFRRLVEDRHKRAKIQEVGKFTFVPIVAESLRHTAELEITLLVPEEPGKAITQGGDLDNRIKTLLDALRMPKAVTELPNGDSPTENESPFFYCLLEDDSLLSGLSIIPDRLLRPVKDPSHVVVIIRVVPRPTYSTIGEIQWTSIE